MPSEWESLALRCVNVLNDEGLLRWRNDDRTFGQRVARISNPGAYAAQVDLDLYRPCFDGLGLSPKFAGTDIDAVFFRPTGGMWERRGQILIQEHKAHPSDRMDWTSGQSQALIALGQKRGVSVIVTFGDPENPAGHEWAHACDKRNTRRCTEDVETWPHRLWLRNVEGNR